MIFRRGRDVPTASPHRIDGRTHKWSFRPLSVESLEERQLLTVAHVALTGSDAAAGTAIAPFRTIQRAVDEAAVANDGNDQILVEGGAYNTTTDGAIVIPSSANIDNLLIEGGYQPGTTFLTRNPVNSPTNYVPQNAGDHVQIDDPGVTIRTINFTFSNTNDGIVIGSDQVTLDGISVTGATNDGIFGNAVSDTSLLDVTSSGNGADGADLQGVAGTTTITGGDFSNNGDRGLELDGSGVGSNLETDVVLTATGNTGDNIRVQSFENFGITGTNGANAFGISPSAVAVQAGPTFLVNFSVQNLRVDGLDGPDTFNVQPSTTMAIAVNGGNPLVSPGDALILDLGGVVAPVVPPLGTGSGTVVSASHKPVAFTGIESLNSVTRDRFEDNDTQVTATVLGSLNAVTLRDLSIADKVVDLGGGVFNVVEDTDFFQYTAPATGKLIVNIFFDPNEGDLQLRARDARGNLIVADGTRSTILPGRDAETFVIPVVAQEIYYIEVLSEVGQTAGYELEVENFAAPIPAGIHLDPASDTGMLAGDNLTADPTPRLVVVADLSDFAQMGIGLLTAAEASAGVTPGAAVEVQISSPASGVVQTGFADAIGAGTFLFDLTANPALTDGVFFATAAVRLFDGQRDGAGAAQPADGRGPLSPPLWLSVDTVAPAAADVTIDMLASSDSGSNTADNITNQTSPAFQGVAEANSKIRLFANGQLVGQGVVGADASDTNAGGAADDGLGLWEITVEPLVDGNYTITVEVEDLAGNVSDPAAGPTLGITVDSLTPQRPTADLVGTDVVDPFPEVLIDPATPVSPVPSDTGLSTLDDVTRGTAPLNPGGQGTTDVQLRISAEPGSNVVVKDGEAVIATFAMPAFDFVFLTLSVDEDPHRISVESTDAAGNRSEQSAELVMVIDVTPPPQPAVPNMVESSDTGVPNDNVTSKMAPAFDGVAEKNARIRLFATNVATGATQLVGQGLVHADESDGSPPAGPLNGLGTWEITVEPLADGQYDIRVEVEDQAGNISPLSDPLSVTIDALAPQRPTVDLVGMDVVDPFPDVLVDPTTPINPVPSDTGLSTLDDVTRGTAPQDPGGQGTTDVQLRISAEPSANVAVKDGETVLVTFTMPNQDFVFLTWTFDEDPHPISVEAFDIAGNRSHQSEALLVTIDVTPPDQPAAPHLLTSSDTGMFDNDNVTSKMSPAFDGVAEKNTLVRVLATNVATGARQIVGEGLVQSDESDGMPPATALNGLGSWEVTVEPLADGTYDIAVELEDQAGNISPFSDPLRIEIDTVEPNLPLLDLVEADDSGRRNDDNVTNNSTPQVNVTSEDPNAAQHTLFQDNLKFRIFDRFEASPEFLLYDSSIDAAVDAVSVPADGFTSLQAVLERLPEQFIGLNAGGNGIVQADGTLVDGIHNLKLEVEDRAGNISHDFLLDLLVDTVAPPVTLVGIDPTLTDTGVDGFPATFADRVTRDTATGFLGRAEADTIVRLYADATANGAIDTAGEFSLTVAAPLDGNDAFPNGQWRTAYLRDLNDPNAPDTFPFDGVREILVTAEDLAGNVNQVDDGTGDANQVLNIFLDTQGPRITAVDVNTQGNTYDLFDPKPSTAGPTPLVNALVISVEDLPNRSNVDPNFLYDALFQQVAEQPGHYRLVGDHNGVIAVASVDYVQNPSPAQDGQPSTGTITLNFAEPLPDDRFTLTLSDAIVDPAGNGLDGETNAVEPQETPLFPTGDGQPGGPFEARFTIDSRPEIGVWAGGSVYVDTNGNFVLDPEGKDNDNTNEDIIYALGFTTDNIFSGNFVAGAGDTADGFDKLAAYGRVGSSFRWLIDTDNDGVPNIMQIDPAGINGLPVAGNFDGNATNGDEVGVFTGSVWYLDTDHDFLVDTVINSAIRGLPIVGDFDGDGADDFATYNEPTDEFQFDLAAGGFGGIDARFDFGFPGIREVPVAADMNQDGLDDVGLFVPDRGGATPRETGEWYFLVSNAVPGGGGSVLDRITLDLQGTPGVPFTPVPFGNDLLAQFGDQFGVPLVGNFDPPVTSSGPATTNPLYQNRRDQTDVNGDGQITPLDALQIINDLNQYGGRALPAGWSNAPGGYIDVNGDQSVSPLDALIVINRLNAASGQVAAVAATATGQAVDQAVDQTPNQAGVDLVMPVAATRPATVTTRVRSAARQETGETAADSAATLAAATGTVEDGLLRHDARLVGRSPVGKGLDELIGAIAQDVTQAWQADDQSDDPLSPIR